VVDSEAAKHHLEHQCRGVPLDIVVHEGPAIINTRINAKHLGEEITILTRRVRESCPKGCVVTIHR